MLLAGLAGYNYIKTAKPVLKSEVPEQDFRKYITVIKPDPALRQKNIDLTKKALIKPVKVFQIGFSNCGTFSLYDFFNRNGVAAQHYNNGDLPRSIEKNAVAGKPLISKSYENYWVYTGLEINEEKVKLNIGASKFKDFDKQYPGSKFILNTRDKQAWLRSRSEKIVWTAEGQTTFLAISKKKLHKSAKEVLALWSQEWDDHHRAVKAYFKNRPNDLLIFNIEQDPPEKLTEFFKNNFLLDHKLFKHLNVSGANTLGSYITERKNYLGPVAREKQEKLAKSAIIKPVKVFQIGFSKCGTTSIFSLFQRSGIESIHHDFGKLALSMYNNFLDGKPLISTNYKGLWLFTDMERMYGEPPLHIGMILFKELDKQYPGSKFILNTRDKQAWLKSRSKHTFMPDSEMTLLEKNQELLKLSKEQVLAKWSKEWDDHHRAVKEYFKDRPRDLIVYNIDTDPVSKLVDFFSENYVLDKNNYGLLNRTDLREQFNSTNIADNKQKKKMCAN